uniref:Preproalyteserin-1/2Ma n=1 Tax=Alytes maurus TaxID=252290 RepID=I3RU60_9ANUR|nr:preproalyteserin-1/2Ma [Alytes maurus]
MNCQYIILVAFLVTSGYAESEVNNLESLSERDLSEEASLREIRGFKEVLKADLGSLVKGIAAHVANGKRSAEEHEEVKRLESVLRDLEAMDLSQEESQTENIKREEPASAVRKEKRFIGKLISAASGLLSHLG